MGREACPALLDHIGQMAANSYSVAATAALTPSP
jgi:hypothetical protein